MKYMLLNPYVEGTTISSNKKDVTMASEEIWNNFASNIKHSTPEFYLTLQDTKDNSLHHLKIMESQEGGNVKFSIELLNNKKYHQNDNILLDEINELKQTGGRKFKFKDSSSSSSSSSSDSSDSSDLEFKFGNSYKSSPIMTLNYYPSIYGVRNILLPSFVSTFAPYVRINLPLINPLIIS